MVGVTATADGDTRIMEATMADGATLTMVEVIIMAIITATTEIQDRTLIITEAAAVTTQIAEQHQLQDIVAEM